MNTIAYLQEQLSNINTIFHSLVDDLTEKEWRTRLAPGHNIVAYTVWHIPRAQDTHVQTWIRGKPEVVHGERWGHWRHLKPYGNGVGISLADADHVSSSIQRSDVEEYADAVHQEIHGWLEGIHENELDILPDISQHLSPYPEYHTPGYIEECRNLFDQPVWSQLMRPCIGHVHRHLGELELMKVFMRTGK